MKNKRIRNVLVVTMALSLLMAIFSFAPINAAGIPTLTLLSPSSGNLGATLNGVVITGTNLTGATKVTISGIGVTASNVFVGSDTQITATLTIASDATAGLRDVTVTTPGGTSATLAGGFSVMNTAGADVFSLDVPAIVAEGGGFYVTINVKGAYQLTNYYLKLNFDPTVVQMAGLDNSHGTSSGISDGVIGGVTIPNHGWSYQPIAGTPSGTISMLYWGPYASGNGYLAKIYFKVLGAAGNQTKLSLFAIDLVDASYNEMFPADPSPVTIAISANTPLVTAVTTNAATAMTNTTATLSGTLTSLGTASTVNLFLGYSTVQGGPYTMVSGPMVNSLPPPSLPLAFSATINGLTASTLYYFVAQAQYGTETVTGTEMAFSYEPHIITSSSLPSGEIGITYSTALAAAGGTPPYTWSIQSGTLPAGLSLSTSGLISGTPTSISGPNTINFAVMDSVGGAGIKSLTISILSEPSITTSVSLPNGEQSAPYSSNLAATGGIPPYTWSVNSGTLPDGLSLSSSGLISGIPTWSGGPTVITFKVTDSVSGNATADLSITVIPGPSITTSLIHHQKNKKGLVGDKFEAKLQ